MGLTDRFDVLQQRHPALGLPLAVIYKYVDDQGSYLAALIAYYALVSLFPLLPSTVLGWVLTEVVPGLVELEVAVPRLIPAAC